MKKQSLYPAVVTGLFCAFLGCGALLSVLMPKKSFSETENRYLAQLPIFSWERLADGTFGTDYEKYLSDQFPFRDSWIGVKTAAEQLQMKKEINGVWLGADQFLFEALYPEDIDRVLYEKNVKRLSVFAQAQEELLGSSHVGVWLGADQFLFEALYPEDIDRVLYEKNVKRLSVFAQAQEELLGSSHVCIMLIPSASQILTEQLPAFASPFQQNQLVTDLENSGISSLMVPVQSALASAHSETHPSDRELYYRTDHHWTSAGAYVGYKAWADSMGFKPLSPSDFTVETVSGNFLGTILG